MKTSTTDPVRIIRRAIITHLDGRRPRGRKAIAFDELSDMFPSDWTVRKLQAACRKHATEIGKSLRLSVEYSPGVGEFRNYWPATLDVAPLR